MQAAESLMLLIHLPLPSCSNCRVIEPALLCFSLLYKDYFLHFSHIPDWDSLMLMLLIDSWHIQSV